jgi:hypothetical protein
MPKRHKGLSWENMEKLLKFATQLASLIELLRKAF